jgi:hypothetical protein
MATETPVKAPPRDPPKVILLYGKPGCGKTTACAELARKAEFGDVYFVNMDMDGIESAYDKDHKLMPGVHHSTMIRSVAELEREWLRLGKRNGIDPAVETVIFDSFSIIDFRIINHVADGGGDPCAAGKMNQQKWGQRTQMVNNHTVQAFNLPFKYVVFTAHEKIARNADGQPTAIYPSVGSENSRAIGEGAFSAVLHMAQKTKTVRELTCNHNPLIVAKCRSKAINAMLNEQGTTTKALNEVLANL